MGGYKSPVPAAAASAAGYKPSVPAAAAWAVDYKSPVPAAAAWAVGYMPPVPAVVDVRPAHRKTDRTENGKGQSNGRSDIVLYSAYPFSFTLSSA